MTQTSIRNRLPAPPSAGGVVEQALARQLQALHGEITKVVHAKDVALRQELIPVLGQLRGRVDKLRAEAVDALVEYRRDSMAALAEVADAINDLRADLGMARIEASDLRTELTTARAELTQVRAELAQLRTDSAALVKNAVEAVRNVRTEKHIEYCPESGRPLTITERVRPEPA